MIKQKRGEIWRVNFDPQVGKEIKKERPAVVLTVDAVKQLPLEIVVPLRKWKKEHEGSPWIVQLVPDESNKLGKKSAADGSQVKSVSVDRFVGYVGILKAAQIEEITKAVRLCIEE